MDEVSADAGLEIEVRDDGKFLALLQRLECSLATSTRPNRLVMLGVADGALALTQCHFYRFFRPMGMTCEGNRIAIATLNELFIFANVPGIAKDLPGSENSHDAVFVPRTMHFTGTCDLHDMVFDGPSVLGVKRGIPVSVAWMDNIISRRSGSRRSSRNWRRRTAVI